MDFKTQKLPDAVVGSAPDSKRKYNSFFVVTTSMHPDGLDETLWLLMQRIGETRKANCPDYNIENVQLAQIETNGTFIVATVVCSPPRDEES